MSVSELLETIDKGLNKAELKMPDFIRRRIAILSQGLPHNTHLLAKQAALAAVRDGRIEINEADYRQAVREAVLDKTESLGKVYNTATYGPNDRDWNQHTRASALRVCVGDDDCCVPACYRLDFTVSYEL